MYSFQSFKLDDIDHIKKLIRDVEWTDHYVEAHVDIALKYMNDNNAEVILAWFNNELAGYIAFEHHKINALTYIATLVVAKKFQGNGLGAKLVNLAEERSKKLNFRGFYLDTTDDNQGAHKFYTSIGLNVAYTMPHYYADNVNGITYLRLYSKIDIDSKY